MHLVLAVLLVSSWCSCCFTAFCVMSKEMIDRLIITPHWLPYRQDGTVNDELTSTAVLSRSWDDHAGDLSPRSIPLPSFPSPGSLFPPPSRFGGAAWFAGPENDGPNRWNMTDHYWDQMAILVLENAYFHYYENSFIGALSSKFTGQKKTNCLFQSNVEYHIPAWSSDLR